ncbi:MAG: hypothetical protein KDA32_12540, partial [Phycisphaerales bacterium]|nr:hypothetical protein [Phycisphaerales bacterium]
ILIYKLGVPGMGLGIALNLVIRYMLQRGADAQLRNLGVVQPPQRVTRRAPAPAAVVRNVRIEPLEA